MITIIWKRKNVPNKLSKFLQITGIINQVLKPSNIQMHTRLWIHNTSNTYSAVWWWKLDTKEIRQIQNHISWDEILKKNHKVHTAWPKKESRHHEQTQNTTSSGRNQQLQTQTDTTHLQHGQISILTCYYEITTSRKEKPRLSNEETSQLL
jgi:hypothetical protein